MEAARFVLHACMLLKRVFCSRVFDKGPSFHACLAPDSCKFRNSFRKSNELRQRYIHVSSNLLQKSIYKLRYFNHRTIYRCRRRLAALKLTNTIVTRLQWFFRTSLLTLTLTLTL
ncbi:hypothetical protein HanXRQr2_Chr17g0787321 [Helianthus annuus]|uniref:Uncharacterized protein n=1 Tax=Helianthus annuus TaxID=4232 RepID=A0A9K3DGY8_HELAN|nr:hypothetical protein HanXRQr2_Chr17g0787321 [Helianthus annuus]